MKEEMIRTLLSEFDYDKNDLDTILDFLIRMCYEIIVLGRK